MPSLSVSLPPKTYAALMQVVGARKVSQVIADMVDAVIGGADSGALQQDLAEIIAAFEVTKVVLEPYLDNVDPLAALENLLKAKQQKWGALPSPEPAGEELDAACYECDNTDCGGRAPGTPQGDECKDSHRDGGDV